MGDFLGESVEFLIEAKSRIESAPNALRLMREVVILKGKIAFYESRIREMSKVSRDALEIALDRADYK